MSGLGGITRKQCFSFNMGAKADANNLYPLKSSKVLSLGEKVEHARFKKKKIICRDLLTLLTFF